MRSSSVSTSSTTAAFSEIYAESSYQRGSNQPPIRCLLRGWWEGERTRKVVGELFGEKDGSHATASEVSVTQYAYPEFIKKAQMEWTGKAKRGFYDAEDYRRTFPDGRIGSDPAQASSEKGQRIIDASVQSLLKDVAEFAAEPLPGV